MPLHAAAVQINIHRRVKLEVCSLWVRMLLSVQPSSWSQSHFCVCSENSRWDELFSCESPLLIHARLAAGV